MNPLLLFLAIAAAPPQDSARLSVTAAVDRALASHPTVAAARANVDVASAEVGQARAAWFPAISLDASVNRFEKPMVVYPLHALDLRNPPFFDTKLSQASIAASYTLFDFGARSSKVRAAVSQRDAADATLGAAEQLLVARTTSAYMRVLTVRGILAAEDQRVAALASELQRSRDRFTAGKAARVDTLRAASELASAAADRVSSAANVEMAEHELARLIGSPFDAVHASSLGRVQLSGAAIGDFSATGPTVEHATLVERANAANADVRAAERRADAAGASVGAARAGRLPTLQATSAVVDRGNLTGRYLAEWQVGVGLSWPVFTGGARESAINRAEASARSAREQVRLSKLNAEQQVDEARAAFAASRARVAALEAAVQQSDEVAHITQLSRDVGDGTQTDYLLAEASLFRARSALVQARHAVIAARVELARVLGELSRSWIASSLESLP